MQLKTHSMKMGENGGYEGYACIVLDDSGKEHAVLAHPRQHSSISSIIKAAFAAVAEEAISRREAQIEKAAEIMAQVEAEKVAKLEVAVPSETSDSSAVHIGPVETDPDVKFEFVGASDKPPVFEGEDNLKEPNLEEDEPSPKVEKTMPGNLEGYTVPKGMPEMIWMKGEIRLYLYQNEIPYDDEMTKAKLLEQVVLHSGD